MKPAPRRLTFQLVSLFDLLIIVVFAQYLDLNDSAQRKVAQASDLAEKLKRQHAAESRLLGDGRILRELEDEIERQALEHEQFKQAAAQREFELAEESRRSRDDLTRLGGLVAELFDLPATELDRLLRSRTAEEAERIRRALRELSAGHGGEAVRHILTLAELEKRCDVWQIHIGDDNAYTFEGGGRKSRFRADDVERFATELFRLYKNLPQPKSLVLMLVSWGDAELRARAAAVNGLELAAERMRADSDRRSRFEYAVLGYIPSPEGPQAEPEEAP
jgi:hypothetical protein